MKIPWLLNWIYKSQHLNLPTKETRSRKGLPGIKILLMVVNCCGQLFSVARANLAAA